MLSCRVIALWLSCAMPGMSIAPAVFDQISLFSHSIPHVLDADVLLLNMDRRIYMGKPSACCSIMCWVSLLAMSMVLHRDQGTQSSDVITLLLRACFENMVIRTILPGADRSIVGFGPACSFIALHDCDLGGVSGLLVPRTKVSASYQPYPRRDFFVPYQYLCVCLPT